MVAATPPSLAFSIVISMARSETVYPKPQWPSTTVVVAVSWTTSNGAPATMCPRFIRSMYVGIWMMPWESCPARLAPMVCLATTAASSLAAPAAWRSAEAISLSRSGGTFGIWSS